MSLAYTYQKIEDGARRLIGDMRLVAESDGALTRAASECFRDVAKLLTVVAVLAQKYRDVHCPEAQDSRIIMAARR